MKDASQNALVAQRLLGDASEMAAELNKKYAHMRDDYAKSHSQLLSIEEARKRKPKLF